jgi:hypothetical protein
MSTTGARIRDGRVARLARTLRAEQMSPAAEPSPAHTPYRLLWSTGIVALVLGAAAFMLWGLNGASTLFDLIAAFCA